jgi:hypothetical protein
MEERREISTADLVKTADANDRTAKGEAQTVPGEEAPQTSRVMLFPNDEAERLRSEWTNVQSGFVDEPREAVQRADQLVAGTMKRIATVFAEERHNLEQQWDRGDNVTTEDLRVALQRYRAFFDRLLSV